MSREVSMAHKDNSRDDVSWAAHLQTCKEEALPYCAEGDVLTAWCALRDGLLQHLETCDHNTISIGTLLFSLGQLNAPETMCAFIQGLD